MHTLFSNIRKLQIGLLLSALLLALSQLVTAQEAVLEVDLLITAGGKRADNSHVVIYTKGRVEERFESTHKGIVHFILDPGFEHKVVVSADNCLPKIIIFDTTDPKAKADRYPCDVDLSVVSVKKKTEISEVIPVGVVRWIRGKRKWGHDAEYTKEMQERYRAEAKAKGLKKP